MRRILGPTASGFKLFCALAAVLFLLPSSAAALAIGFELSPQVVNLGDPVSIDLIISGLGAGVPPSLGAFDLDVTFDTNVLSFVDYSLGPDLGDLVLVEAFDLSLGESAPGTVNVAELSLLNPSELDFFQSDSFALATLMFATEGVGTTSLDVPLMILSDGFGVELFDDVMPGSITVRDQPPPVPEPASLLLLGSGLLGMGLLRRRSGK